MVGYIVHLTEATIKHLDECKGTEFHAYAQALREELDRLDPRDFAPASQFPFVQSRIIVRSFADQKADSWYKLLAQLSGHHSTLRHHYEERDRLQAASQGWDDTPVRKAIEGNQQLRDNVETVRKDLNTLITVLGKYGGEGSHVVERSFPFVADPKLRTIVERDYRELVRSLFPARAWKSVVILAGSILEAILYDQLTKDAVVLAKAIGSQRAPKDNRGVVKNLVAGEWVLARMIDVACDEAVIPKSREGMFDHTLREYRNFVHPLVERNEPTVCNRAEAELAIGALHAVYQYLHP